MARNHAEEITPRRRYGSAGPELSPAQNTPYGTLQRLASLAGDPITPAGRPRRSLSTSRISSFRSSQGPANIGGGDGRGPATPHALKAFQRRAAAYTPGRDRRKSGRVNRETPLDILRNLGRALAPITQIIESSSITGSDPGPAVSEESDELDQEPDLPKPRLSLPMNEMIVAEEDDGSPEIDPPRLSLLPEDNDITQQSIEMPRRERSARDRATLSRYSLASARFSEHFGDASRLEDTEEGLEFTAPLLNDQFVDDQVDMAAEPTEFDIGGDTEDLRRFDLNFSFPTPEAPQHLDNDQEDFILDTTMPIADNASVSSDDDFGAEGLELTMPDVQIDSQRSSDRTSSEIDPRINSEISKSMQNGNSVPKLPRGIVKRLATRFARTGAGHKTRLSKETLAAIEQATEWFFEQTSKDLTAYSDHSRRKTVDEADVVALMRRQRQLNNGASIFALAQKHLPRELLQDLHLPKR